MRLCQGAAPPEHGGSPEGTGGSHRIVKQTGFEGRRVTWAVPWHGADLAHITSGPVAEGLHAERWRPMAMLGPQPEIYGDLELA